MAESSAGHQIVSVEQIRFITPELATVDGSWTVTGARGAGGKVLAPIKVEDLRSFRRETVNGDSSQLAKIGDLQRKLVALGCFFSSLQLNAFVNRELNVAHYPDLRSVDFLLFLPYTRKVGGVTRTLVARPANSAACSKVSSYRRMNRIVSSSPR